MNNMIIMGPPGAGKGTQSERIVAQFKVPHISTGDMFRAAIANKTELGLLAESYIKRGALVPDEVTISLVKERLSKDDCKNGFILDGFPRNIPQGEALDKLLNKHNISLDAVLEIDVPDEAIIDRLSGRRYCAACGRTYHIDAKLPTEEEKSKCPERCENLILREDDRPEVVKQRLVIYHDVTEHLKPYYKAQNKLITVVGRKVLEKTSRDVDRALEEIAKM